MIFALRYNLRLIRRSPLFALSVIITLALSIGGNGLIFGIIDCVLIRPLPYGNSDRIVRVFETFPASTGRGFGSVSGPNFLDWRKQAHTFDSLAAYTLRSRNLTQTDRPAAVITASVTEDFFNVFGVDPRLGRTFQSQEIRNEEAPAVLSDAFWQEHFGRDPAVIGTKILLDAKPYTVIGVMPPTFRVPTQCEVWVPLNLRAGDLEERGYHSLAVIGRVRERNSISQAQAEMSAIAIPLARAYPESDAERGVLVRRLKELMVGNVCSILLGLLGAVGFVLVIACANIANLLLARSVERMEEVAMRMALGAHRAQMAVQMIFENVLLALFGGAAGAVLTIVGLNSLRLVLTPGMLPRAAEIGMTRETFAFILTLSLLSGLAFGSAPLYQLISFGSMQALNKSTRGVAGSARASVLRKALVILQIALSLIVLVAAELMAKSLFRLEAVDPGFRPDHVISAQIALPATRYGVGMKAALFFDTLLANLRSVPEVQSAAAVVNMPFGGENMNGPFRIQGRPEFERARAPLAEYVLIAGDYIRTLRIPLLAGRDFNFDDTAARPRVAIVNETMAKLYWPHASPIGSHLVSGDKLHPVFIEIIGVIGDLRLYGLDQSAPAQIYFPLLQQPASTATILLRSTNDPKALLPVLRNKVRELDRDQPVSRVRLMEDLVSDSLGRSRLRALLASLFAALSLALGAVGLYGVIAYTSARRTFEIGIRMALGARPWDIAWKVTGEGLALAAAGVLLGSGMTLLLAPLLKAELYGITPMDIGTLLEVTMLLMGVALVASALPAFRACKVEPITALRQA